MRMPVWDVPSILTAAKIDGKYLRLPRGVESSLKDNCHSYLKEQFTLSKALNVEFTGTLRPQQEEAVNKIDKNKLGMLCAHTGFGKTVVGCALIARRKARTLIIVSTVNIANQWRDAALRFLKIKDVPYKELTKTGRSVKKKQIEMLNEMVKFSQISLTLDKKQRNCDYKLLSNKVDFKLKEKIGNNICVFDQKICWYGDLNFGGNSYKNSSAIRLVNTELAKKITSSKYQI